MTEHYIGDLDADDEKMVRRDLEVQEAAMKELVVVNRMTRQFLEGNISIETYDDALDNMRTMSDYEYMAVNEL